MPLRVRAAAPLALAVATVSCGGSPATPSTTPSSTTAAAVAPAASSEPFTIDLPIAPADSVSIGYGLWPFGVHGSAHALDGHSGFDLEYRPGAPVLAAADGLVDNRTSDAHDPTRVRIQLHHVRAVGNYLTDYSNLISVPPELIPGASVSRGQVIGIAGTFPGGQSAMTHFQLGDPTRRGEPTIIASPADYLTTAARAQLAAIWRTASYVTEWCEPFLTNVRANGFPMSRTWTAQSGTAIAQIEVRCPSDGADMEYRFVAADGAVVESGSMISAWWLRPGTVDFRPTGGAARLGVYDIVEGALQLAINPPGAPRPSSFSAAITYTTR